MAFSDYSLTPGANGFLNGINVAEGCPAGNLNGAIRQLAADGKELSDQIEDLDVDGKLNKAGGTVTGNITRSGAGVHRYNASSSHVSGATYFLAEGATRPTAAEGVVVFYY